MQVAYQAGVDRAYLHACGAEVVACCILGCICVFCFHPCVQKWMEKEQVDL